MSKVHKGSISRLYTELVKNNKKRDQNMEENEQRI